jgi:hypothetical protein
MYYMTTAAHASSACGYPEQRITPVLKQPSDALLRCCVVSCSVRVCDLLQRPACGLQDTLQWCALQEG